MIEGLLLAFALAMDAFAVALTQGPRFRPDWTDAVRIALAFGTFQAVMPLIGWGIGASAFAFIEAVDHWVAFAILAFLGARMLGGHVGEGQAQRALTGTALLVASLATSVDALAAGVTLPTLAIAPLTAAALIGCVTLVMSAVGVALGRMAGDRWGAWAERAGGLILIALGFKILGEHTGFL